MSVICQNFVQNAWKKDLCSNCFKSVGDHEGIDVTQDCGDSLSSIPENPNGNSNGYTARTETPPHTTWKTLIAERNSKNSQPFKLENGFQGRLLTINKALNGTDKQNKGDIANNKLKPQTNGFSVKTTNGDVKKAAGKPEALSQVKKNIANGNKFINGQNFERSVNCHKNQQKQSLSPLSNENARNGECKVLEKANSSEKHTNSKFSKDKIEEAKQDVNLQGILKKNNTAISVDNNQTRRSTINVGFKDEEPLVIGYGGRDFSPEELEWEMASSDGDAEPGSDSLDETEDDKVFSKMTKQNTEFNSDNTNLLHNKNGNNTEAKSCDQNESQNSTEREKNGALKVETSNNDNQQCQKSVKSNSNAQTGVSHSPQNKEQTRISDKTESSSNNKRTSSPENSEISDVESKNSKEPAINVTMSGEKKNLAVKTRGITIVKARDAEAFGVDAKNNSQFINGTASPSSFVDAPCKIDSGNTADGVMFSDGDGTTCQGYSSGSGSNEWQDEDVIPGQILQAINTSLTNRHKMRENPEGTENDTDIGRLEENDTENEANKISLSINNQVSLTPGEKEIDAQNEAAFNVEPRESFLHGVVSKPSAIYGPASDFFVSRSNSSSSSSSDEQSKGQISLSINVIVNGGDSTKRTEEPNSDNDENIDSSIPKEREADRVTCTTAIRSKPEIPAKPIKPLQCDKRNRCDKREDLNTLIQEESNAVSDKDGGIVEASYYSTVPDRTRTTINLIDPYAESNIYQEVNEKDFVKTQDMEEAPKAPGRESKLAALAIELEQARHANAGTKRQAPAPPKVPDPPMEDPPSCAGRISPSADLPHNFSTFRGESMGFSSASSTTSTSSQDTEAGYASWNLHGYSEDNPKISKSKSSFLLTQYSKCKMLAMGYAEDSAKARKKFSIKKLLKIGKETEPPVALDPNSPNPKAWKYSDHFERPRAKLEIIHPMDLENKTVTVNPGFDSLHSSSLSSFNPNTSNNSDHLSFRNSVSSDYGSFYSDTLSPSQDVKQEANYEYIQPRQSTIEENEESSSKTGTSSSTSPTPSRSSTASHASTVTSGSSKSGSAPHRPPKPPPPPRAHSLLPANKVIRNPDGTFKFPNGEISSSDEVTSSPTKPQAPKRQCKSTIIRSDCIHFDEQVTIEESQDMKSITQNTPNVLPQSVSHEESSIAPNSHSIQIIKKEIEEDCKEQDEKPVGQFEEGLYDNLESPKIQTSITIKTGTTNQNEKLSTCVLSRNKHPPLSKAPARPPPIYSKPQPGNSPKNICPWKTLEDSYLALTSSNRELLIKFANQSIKKRKNIVCKLNKHQFHWTDFEIDVSQASAVFAFGEKIAYHATMPKYPEYLLTLVISVQQQSQLQENSDFKYPMFGTFSDYIPSELLDNSGDSESEPVPGTVLILDRSHILTIECFSESLSETLTEENEKELCFITLQLIQSLKSLQAQGIESIDTSCQNLLLAKTKHDKYHTLVFLYDTSYEESDYSSDSCKISLCQYTLMLLLQMLKIQDIDDATLASKFSSSMSRKVFETAFSFLSEEKAVSLSQTKTLFECYLWGVTKVLESLQMADDCDSILHRWLDIERSNCIKCIVNEDSGDVNVQNEYYSQFLIRTTVRNIREVVFYL